MRIKNGFSSFIIITVLILLDQLIKYFIVSSKVKVEVLFITIELIRNRGLFFGFISLNRFIIIGIHLAILILIVVLFSFKNTKFIIAGVISNIIDRLLYKSVIDYINLKVWPVFNLADVYITIGVILLLLKLKKNGSSNRYKGTKGINRNYKRSIKRS